MNINFKKNDDCKLIIKFAFKNDAISPILALQGFDGSASQTAT